MPTLRFAACSVIVRSPMMRTSPKGMAMKVTSAGTSARIGARVCKSLSAPGGTKSSLVKSLIGSATKVLMMPRLKGSLPKIAARLAPMRSCTAALPLRSTHKSNPPRLSTIKRTMKVRKKVIPKSIMVSLRVRRQAQHERLPNPVTLSRSKGDQGFSSRLLRFFHQLVDQPYHALRSEVLVVIRVDLCHWRGPAGAQALDLTERKFPIRGCLP